MSCNWPTIRFWLLVLVLAVAPVGAPAFAQGATVVRVEPAASSVQVYQTVNLSIKVDNIANLTAFELHLSFNPAVLEVTGISNGGFVAADFTAQNTFDNAAGTIDYAIAQMNRPPAQGNGTLLSIAFRARGTGASTVTTRSTPAAPGGLLLSDQNGMSIQASWQPGSVTVTDTQSSTNTPTATPTPTSTSPFTPTPTSTFSFTPTPTSTSVFTATPTSTTTSTATSTSTPTVTPPPPGQWGMHIVRWGEWLYCIARAYRVSPSAIIEANRLWWPHLLFPNQRLIIPNIPWTNMTQGPVCQAQFTFPGPTPAPTVVPTTPGVTPTATPTPIPVTTSPPSGCRAIYVVRRGDTLYRIALWYGTTYTEIARVNQLQNPRLIYPGQQLCIP